MSHNKLKVIISGGGTGGHIFPAIAIANALKETVGNIDILFVGAKGRMEMEKVPAAGYQIKGLWISGLQRKLTMKNLLFPLKVVYSYIKARGIIKSFKPDVVVGVGGYASGPTLRAAISLKVPTIIQEQNSFPGITNKMLAKKVDSICVAYPNMEKYFPADKIHFTGNPVRSDVVKIEGKLDEAINFFNLMHGKKTILVIGGSLGALTINKSIAKIGKELIDKNIQLIWQTGKSYFENAKQLVKEQNLNDIKVYDFINRMDLAYAAADVIVSRAGAIAVSELCLVKKPVILIPSPNVAEDHQTKNAMALVNRDAALIVKDIEAEERLLDCLLSLVNDIELQTKLSKNIALLGMENAASYIAKLVIELANKKS